MKKQIRTVALLLATAAALSCNSSNTVVSQEGLTRGIGVYPGRADQDPSPVMAADDSYRNIALRKAVYQSSAVDYNYVAQLVTDGIVETQEAAYFRMSDQDGEIKKNDKEFVLDFAPYSKYVIKGRKDVSMQIDFVNISQPVDRIEFTGYLDGTEATDFTYALLASHDGSSWDTLSEGKGTRRIGIDTKEVADMDYSHYKVCFSAEKSVDWNMSNWIFSLDGEHIPMYTTNYFRSFWVSAGRADEWLYVDFGAKSSFDKVKLSWVNKAESGELQVSDDAKSWKKIASLPGGSSKVDEIDVKGSGRYLRVTMDKAADGERIALTEIEVMGRGALAASPKAQPAARDGKLALTQGNWKLERASEVSAEGPVIAAAGFDDSSWLVATVPGTVLKSFMETGAVPDPNYSDNQTCISDSYFYSDFWYRDTFTVPANFAEDRVFLNFDGINWKADVYLNGSKLGFIEGAFTDAVYDVTDIIAKGAENQLAVLIHRPAHQGPATEQSRETSDFNGGDLGKDNPTFHASIGWDWIPTVRGRNIGIWNDVYLTTTGNVTIEDAFANTTLNLPDTTKAEVAITATLVNHSDKAVAANWSGNYGGRSFGQELTLKAGESREVSAHISIDNPELWWPVGYGNPVLQDVAMEAKSDGVISDVIEFKSGIRQMTYEERDGILYMYVNGRRFIGRGGNWGFSESNLAFRQREYDAALAYHADLNFSMIRNWVGQTGDEEFYDACDKYGVMIWQDFWLANPADGPDPDDEVMFMQNAENWVKRIRNHPSIGLYCGRNEGVPPVTLDNAIRKMLPELHPGMWYISDSADKVVSGHGPYEVQTTERYFQLPHKETFHSERGMPSVLTYESTCLTIPEDRNWPHNDLWGLHDFALEGAAKATSFLAATEKAFGPSSTAKEFTTRAQWINYDGYRAMFESRSEYRQGLLLWMSHSAWPSNSWQVYDYFFEANGAYFGSKKACEPLHIQWNPVTKKVEVVNISARDRKSLTADAVIYDIKGKEVEHKSASLDILEDETLSCIELDAPADITDVWYIRLRLIENGNTVSENFYIEGKEPGNFQALATLPAAKTQLSTELADLGDSWELTCKVKNASATPALRIRLNVKGSKSGERILPAIYSDNYICLLGGEEQTITVTVKKEDCHGETPAAEIIK